MTNVQIRIFPRINLSWTFGNSDSTPVYGFWCFKPVTALRQARAVFARAMSNLEEKGASYASDAMYWPLALRNYFQALLKFSRNQAKFLLSICMNV
jgi:hypothetical protein